MDISVYILFDRYKEEYDRDVVGVYSSMDALIEGLKKYVKSEYVDTVYRHIEEVCTSIAESYEYGGFSVEKVVLDKTYGSSGDGIP